MDLKQILERMNKIASDMRALHQLAEDEERGFTSDEKEKWEQLRADYEQLEAQQKRAQELDDMDGRSSLILPEPQDDDSPTPQDGEGEQRSDDEKYAEAFSALLRSTEAGYNGLAPEQRQLMQQYEQRAQATTPGSAGGFLVPEGFGDRVIETMQQFGGIQAASFDLPTATGNPLPFPTNDDTGNSSVIIDENTQDSEQDLVFGEVRLGAYTYTSRIIRVSVELLQDSAIDMDAFIARKFGQRHGRGVSAHLATGNGTTQPEGITVGSTAGQTAAGAAAITWADILGLEHSLDPAYRASPGVRFVFADSTLEALKAINDSQGRPIWLPAIQSSTSVGAPGTIYGHRYVVDQGMPAIATTNISVIFGDLQEYYVRRVLGMQMVRLVERYADFRQVGFMSFLRLDAKVMDGEALKRLTHP